MFKDLLKKIPRCVIYALPMFAFFVIVWLAYWPGIMVSDSVFQWDQAKTGLITNWHPAYYTMYIMILSKIVDSPSLVIFLQLTIMSLCIGSFLGKLEKYYGVNRIYLLICSLLLSLIPINYNSAVIMLKDSLYSAFLVLLASISIDIINNKDYFKKITNCLKFSGVCLLVMFMRHNGFLVIGMYCVILIFLMLKEYRLYIITVSVMVIYFLMTTVGFAVFSIEEDNQANKYGPISHIYARILNEEPDRLSDEDIEALSQYVDVERLKETYVPYNMDHSINSQYKEVIKEKGNEYLKMALKEFVKDPRVVFMHYAFLYSYLYKPERPEDYFYVGMFTETDLWIFDGQYPECNEQSKIPWLMDILKNNSEKYQETDIGDYTMWPSWYLYITILGTLAFSLTHKNKKIFLIGILSPLNMLSLAPAMPVAMTRYVYSTILIGFLFAIWGGYEIYREIKKLCIKKKQCSN